MRTDGVVTVLQGGWGCSSSINGAPTSSRFGLRQDKASAPGHPPARQPLSFSPSLPKNMTSCRWSATPSAAQHQQGVWRPPLPPPLGTAPEYFTAINCCQALGKELGGFFSFPSPCELFTVKTDCLQTLSCRHSTSKTGNLSPKVHNSISTH